VTLSLTMVRTQKVRTQKERGSNMQNNGNVQIDDAAVKQILEFAQARDKHGNQEYTYIEIAQLVGCDLRAHHVSAVCLKHGIRRKSRSAESAIESENEIVQQISALHEKLKIVRQQVKIVWALTGKRFVVDNIDCKTDDQIMAAVKGFLAVQHDNRVAVSKDSAGV
jgi:hypothetical protein